MIEMYREDSINLKLINDDDKALDTFRNIMSKVRNEAKKKGFKNMFNPTEKVFIQEFTNRLLGDETNS